MQLKHGAKSIENKDNLKSSLHSEELDSNRYSDDLTFGSGVGGSYREPPKIVDASDKEIFKAIYGSQQNIKPFFPRTFIRSEKKINNVMGTFDQGQKYVEEKETVCVKSKTIYIY